MSFIHWLAEDCHQILENAEDSDQIGPFDRWIRRTGTLWSDQNCQELLTVLGEIKWLLM